MIIVAEKIHVIGDFGIFFMDPRRTDRVSDCKLKVIRDLKEVTMVEVLKVSGKSNPNSVAGALAGVLREKGGDRSGRSESGGKGGSHRKRFCGAGRNRSGLRSGFYGYIYRGRRTYRDQTDYRTEIIRRFLRAAKRNKSEGVKAASAENKNSIEGASKRIGSSQWSFRLPAVISPERIVSLRSIFSFLQKRRECRASATFRNWLPFLLKYPGFP